MNEYELALIIKPTLPDEEIAKQKAGIEEFIKAEKGTIGKWEEWGRRRMTYVIKHEINGYYLFGSFSAEPGVILKLDKKLKLDKTVLRFLLTKK